MEHHVGMNALLAPAIGAAAALSGIALTSWLAARRARRDKVFDAYCTAIASLSDLEQWYKSKCRALQAGARRSRAASFEDEAFTEYFVSLFRQVANVELLLSRPAQQIFVALEQVLMEDREDAGARATAGRDAIINAKTRLKRIAERELGTARKGRSLESL